MDRFIPFGPIYLRQYPSGTNLSFRSKFSIHISTEQQCLLDNLWASRNTVEKVRSLNALAFYFSQLQESRHETSSSSQIVLCNTCEVMTRTLKKLNEQKQTLEDKIQKVESNFLWSPFLFRQLPAEIKLNIRQLSFEKSVRKQQFIMNFIKDLAIINFNHPGLTFTWEIYHDLCTPCQNLFDSCQAVPLERIGCRCQLVYSIVRCCVDTDYFKPLDIIFEQEPVEITIPVLLDYGLLYQIVIADPDHTDIFGRKLAVCLLNMFMNTRTNNYVEIHIISKAPEWDLAGIIPA